MFHIVRFIKSQSPYVLLKDFVGAFAIVVMLAVGLFLLGTV